MWHQAGNISDLSSPLPVLPLFLLHLLPGPCKMVHKSQGMLRPTLEVGQHSKGLVSLLHLFKYFDDRCQILYIKSTGQPVTQEIRPHLNLVMTGK